MGNNICRKQCRQRTQQEFLLVQLLGMLEVNVKYLGSSLLSRLYTLKAVLLAQNLVTGQPIICGRTVDNLGSDFVFGGSVYGWLLRSLRVGAVVVRICGRSGQLVVCCGLLVRVGGCIEFGDVWL